MSKADQQELDDRLSLLELRIERLEMMLISAERQKQKDAIESINGRSTWAENKNLNALGVATIGDLNGIRLP